MKELIKEERDEILKRPYISAADVYKVLPVGRNQAYQMFKELYDELESKGVMLFKTLPRVVPTKYFKEKYL